MTTPKGDSEGDGPVTGETLSWAAGEETPDTQQVWDLEHEEKARRIAEDDLSRKLKQVRIGRFLPRQPAVIANKQSAFRTTGASSSSGWPGRAPASYTGTLAPVRFTYTVRLSLRIPPGTTSSVPSRLSSGRSRLLSPSNTASSCSPPTTMDRVAHLHCTRYSHAMRISLVATPVFPA